MSAIYWYIGATGLAIVAFNLPILWASILVSRTPNLSMELGKLFKEKDSSGDQTDATSYSRITGAIGTVMMGSLFWIISNICIASAILHPANLGLILASSGKLFLVGAALFLPYAFNQLKSVLQ